MSRWVAVWGSSPALVKTSPCRYARNITLRYTLRAMLNGSAIRLRLNNLFGGEDVTIARVCVQKQGAAAIPVTFGGGAPCRIPKGGRAVSDEIAFPLTRGEDYDVSFYIGGLTCMESGTAVTGPLSRFAYAEGDHADEAVLPSFHANQMETPYFLDTVDLLTDDESARAVCCFGDSITAQAWPDYLALRVLREKREHLSVIRRGIGGSRVLRQYEYMQHRHYGVRGLDRFEYEAGAAGVDRVIILHGINDIIHPGTNEFRPWSDLPAPQELIDGLRWYVDKGHDMGLRVYLGTIMTVKGWTGYVPERDALRHAVNDWIRTQRVADGVVDFDAACRSAADPDSREPRYDRGDHIHPSLEGAEHMAESVPGAYLE